MSELALRPALLILVAALGYAVATWLMKLAALSGNYAFLLAIAAILLLTATAEVLLLQRMDLGAAYIAIIAAESILVLSLSWGMGEGFGPRELSGAGLVVLGTILVTT